MTEIIVIHKAPSTSEIVSLLVCAFFLVIMLIFYLSDDFSIFILLFGIIMFYFLINGLLWQIKGEEIFIFKEECVEIKKKIFWTLRSTFVNYSDIEDCYINNDSSNNSRLHIDSFWYLKILFQSLCKSGGILSIICFEKESVYCQGSLIDAKKLSRTLNQYIEQWKDENNM